MPVEFVQFRFQFRFQFLAQIHRPEDLALHRPNHRDFLLNPLGGLRVGAVADEEPFAVF